MFKKVVYLSVILILALFTAVFVHAAEGDFATSPRERVLPDTDEFTVSGRLPIIVLNSASADGVSIAELSRLQQQINTEIDNILAAKIEEGRVNRARNVTFSYTIESSEDYESIVIFSVISRPGMVLHRANSININKNTYSVIDFNDVLGPNAVKLVNTYLSALIWSDLAKYNPAFSGITAQHAFFVQDDYIFLIFGSYEITKGSPQPELIKLPLSIINNFTIETNDTGLSLLLPLRDICNFFGYEVVWRGFTEPITITKDNFSTDIVLFTNAYKKGAIEITLESEPTHIYGTTHVPITFFEEILGLSYYVDEGFVVTISELTEVPAVRPNLP